MRVESVIADCSPLNNQETLFHYCQIQRTLQAVGKLFFTFLLKKILKNFFVGILFITD